MASVKKDKETGLWYCRVSYTDKSGKYRQKSRHGFNTKKEAEAVSRELKDMIDKDLGLFEGGIPFADYFENWAHTYKIGSVGISTEKKYLYNIGLVQDYFGKTSLNKVTRKMYQDFITERGKDRGKDTVQKTHYYIKSCFQNAVEDGLLSINPTTKAVLTYEKEYEDEKPAWSQRESTLLYEYLLSKVDLRNAMLFIALTTGMRIGEVYALEWDNFTDKTLSIKRGYDYTHNKDFTNGKNKYVKRTISITPDVHEYVTKYKEKMQLMQPKNLFLTQKDKAVVQHGNLYKYLKRICRDLDIPQYSINSLRHTHCSLLINQEVGINYISKRLGHSSTIETQKTYSHMIEEYESRHEKKIDIFQKK